MAAPTVPFYGKDSDRLAKLGLAYKALMESGSFLETWPVTVATPTQFKRTAKGDAPAILRNFILSSIR